MSEMVERIAEAAVKAWTAKPKPLRDWSDVARAVLVAMREPTEKMVMAGEPVVYDCYSPEPGEGLDENPAVPTWQAMIDAALKEPK